jgi:hypothetical protein
MKRLLITFVVVVCAITAQAQFFTGLNGSQYAGITTVDFNPAIANSPFIADINIIGAGVAVNNNYIGLDRRVIFHPSLFSSTDFEGNYLTQRLNGNDKNAYVGTTVQGPLSFMFSFGPKKHRNRNAIGFSYHFNSVTNVDNVNQTLAQAAYYGFGTNAQQATHFLDENLTDARLGIKTLAWNDFGITYSRVIYEKGDNLIKVGGTLKLLEPLAGGYIYSSYLSYKWPEYGFLSINKTNVNYAYSQGIITSTSQYSVQNMLSFNNASPSLAADMGVVYEWNPDKSKDVMEMDCGTVSGYVPKPYKLAAGVSIIDFGAVRFKEGINSGNFYANIQDWYVAKAQFPDGIQSFSDTVNSRFQYTQNNRTTFTVWLPTRFNLFVDYNIDHGFGAIVSSTISPNMSPNGNMVHEVTLFTVTGKYEHKWFGVYVPISYDIYGNPSLGLTLRIGPLIVGSQDILGLLMKKYVYNEEVHAALKITIPYHKVHHKYDVRFNKET